MTAKTLTAEQERARVFRAAAAELAVTIRGIELHLAPRLLEDTSAADAAHERRREHLEDLRVCLMGMAADLEAGTLANCLRHLRGPSYVASVLDLGRNFYRTMEPIDREAVDALRGYITAVDTVQDDMPTMTGNEVLAYRWLLLGDVRDRPQGDRPLPEHLVDGLQQLDAHGYIRVTEHMYQPTPAGRDAWRRQVTTYGAAATATVDGRLCGGREYYNELYLPDGRWIPSRSLPDLKCHNVYEMTMDALGWPVVGSSSVSETHTNTENETMTTEQTTTDAAATTAAANHVATEDRLERIALELVYPTPENCRTMPWGATAAPELVVRTGQLALADETHEAWQDDRWRAMLELALSLREHGQVQPALVRVHPEIAGCYDLRAGERRMWAAKIAGLPTLLCVVRDLTDQQALEVTVNENLLRSDLTPLEEGAAIAQLLDRGWDVEGVAAHLGKSEKWVRRRAQIQMVTMPWRQRLRDAEHPASSWGVGHLEILARLPSETQNALLEELGDDHWRFESVSTVAGLWKRADAFTRAMKSAPWKLDDKHLLPKAGACASCPKRSSCQPMLFDEDETGGDDHCLDGGCWAEKTAAYVAQRTAALREEYGDELLLLSERYHYGYGEKREPGISYQNEWREAKKKDAGSVPGLLVAGHRAGTKLWVRLTSSARAGAAGTDGKPKPKTLKERRAGLAAKRAAVAITQVQELLTAPDSEPVDILEDSEPLAYMLALISAFGVSGMPHPDLPKSRDRWDAVTEETSMEDQEVIMSLWRRLAGGPLLSTLAFETQAQAPDRVPAAKRVCEMIGADWDALLREATEACPEPKSWAKLNADGTPKTDKAAPKKKAKKTAKTKKKAQAEESEVDTHQPGAGEECPTCGAEVPTDDDGCLCEDCGRGVCAACVDVSDDGDVRCEICAGTVAAEESEVAE